MKYIKVIDESAYCGREIVSCIMRNTGQHMYLFHDINCIKSIHNSNLSMGASGNIKNAVGLFLAEMLEAYDTKR